MNGAEKQREIFRRAEVVRGEVRKLRDKDPQLTHVQAWRKLLQTKPHLFADVSDEGVGEGKDSGLPTKYALAGAGERQNAGNAAVREGMQLIRAQVCQDLREAVDEVQQAQPDLSFVEAWQLAKKENPSLFAGAARIEAGDWSSGGASARLPSLVHAVKKPAVRSKPKVDDREVYVVYASDGSVADVVFE